jgi:hypothetical protein
VSLHLRRSLAVLAMAATVVACSPALNWREIPLNGLATLLPCKPDHAERVLQLGAAQVPLRMSGCEAAGALYAISHVQVQDVSQLQVVHQNWRQASLVAMQATNVPVPLVKPPAMPAGPNRMGLRPEAFDGKRPDGSAVQVQILWLAKGKDIYQVAVYGNKLQPEMTELLFSELSLR